MGDVAAYAIVVVITVLAGAWSLPVGLLLGLPAAGVYIAALAGSSIYTAAVLVLGGRARDWLFDHWFRGIDERVRTGRAKEILDRWGVPGLAVVGGVLLGPTVTLAAALILGVPRGRFAVWYAASTVVGFALLTAFWTLVL